MGVNETPNWVLRVHAGNQKLARIFGLSIKQMPAHEGGGWYMSITDAQRIMRSTHIDELAAAARGLVDVSEDTESAEVKAACALVDAALAKIEG